MISDSSARREMSFVKILIVPSAFIYFSTYYIKEEEQQNYHRQ
jgi:hypothetical protein